MARKIEFNRDEALKKSMILFWEKGYENTSMQDLVTTLEINRFSIYNTYGDKKALFHQALEYYRTHIFEMLNQPLINNEASGKKRLDNYLENFGKHISSTKGSLGCMIQASTLSEISREKEIINDLNLFPPKPNNSPIPNELMGDKEKESQPNYLVYGLIGLGVIVGAFLIFKKK